MAVYLAPDPFQSTFFIPGSNTPANGGQLFFYQAGSSTKQTVYKDSAGGVAWTNPIVLDSGGNIPLGNEVWFTGGVTYKVVFAPSTDTDPPVSPYWSKDNLSGMNDVTSTASQEWVAGPTPTFVSATSFTCVGDQTAILTSGRRIKTTNTSGTVYSTIITATFAVGITTVVVRSDQATVLDSGLAALSYALLSSIGPSVPLMTDAYPIRSASSAPFNTLSVSLSGVTGSSNIVQTIPNYSYTPQTQNNASTLAESSMVAVSSANGSFVQYGGTTAITQFNLFPGQDFTIKFTSSCTLIYSASSLALPGGQNVTTQAGDTIILRGSSSSVGIPISFQSGVGILNGGEVLLAMGTVLNTSQVDIIYSSAPYTNFRNKRLVLTNWIPSNAAGGLAMRWSSTGGVNFDAGANAYASTFLSNDNTINFSSNGNASTYVLMTNIFTGGGTVTSGMNYEVKLYDTTAGTHWAHCSFQGSYVDSSAANRLAMTVGSGARAAAFQNTAARLFMTSGGSTVSSGAWALYGYN